MKYFSGILSGLLLSTSVTSEAAKLTIYSSDGSGTIDKPVVMVEGYDPYNNINVETYVEGGKIIEGYYDRIPPDFTMAEHKNINPL